jgi:phospholipid/cholesterol/gamma-HCH transport system substrate-binding protein
METRANYALVGLFTLAVVAGGFGFVWWFSGHDARSRYVNYRVVFTGSVSGLSRGSSVLFNGLRVGEVVQLNIDQDNPSRVFARIEVEPETPINSETRARLELQGLTGTAAVALAGGGPSSPPVSRSRGELPEIIAERSEIQNLLESAQTIARRTDDVLGKLDALMTVNQGAINNTVRNVERFTGSLAESGDTLAETFRNAGELTEKLNRSAERIDLVLKNIESFVGSPEAKGTLGEFTEAAKAIRELARNLDLRATELTTGVGRVTGAGLREIEGLTTEGRRALAELNRLLRDLERNPQQLLFGSKPALPQYNGRQ